MQLFIAFIISLTVTAVLIPPLAHWAPALGLSDRPGPRKVHLVPVPRIGGLAMAVGILVPLLASVDLVPPVAGLLIGLVILLVFGVWDDRSELGYRAKLLGQCLAAVALMTFGDLRIDTLTFSNREPLPELVSVVLTFVFLVGVTNAVNLSDGLDGLAGGMVLLCLSAIALLGASSGDSTVVTVALIQAGAILGFLRFNTHPARVFMGDAGSQVLGFTLGALAIMATQNESSAASASLPLLLLGMPIVDTALVMIRRIRANRSPFSSDSSHIHHRLLGLGLPHRIAVMAIYLAQIGFVLCAYFLRFESDVVIVAIFLALAATIAGLTFTAERSRWRWPSGAGAGAGAASTAASVRGSPNLGALLDRPSWTVMMLGFFGYGATVVAMSPPVRFDVASLCLVMVAALLVLLLGRGRVSAAWLDRTVTYVAVVVIVHIDQSNAAPDLLLARASWALLAVTVCATAVRFCLSPARRFEVTSLDLLVLFVGIVIPNLPGNLGISETLTVGVAKAVLLLYVVEMLLIAERAAALRRLGLVLLLGAVVLRAGATSFA